MRIANGSPASAARSRDRVGRYWPTLLVAIVCAVIAFENGGYGLMARTILAVCVLWATIIGIAFGFLPRVEVTRGGVTIGALLAGLAVWTLASTAWAPNAGAAFDEFNRVVLYLAVFALASVAATRRDIGRWADGLCIGVVVTGVIALSSRLFPSLFPSSRDLGVFLPSAVTRLSFPVGYWNGLAVLVGLGFPLCLRAAMVGGPSVDPRPRDRGDTRAGLGRLPGLVARRRRDGARRHRGLLRLHRPPLGGAGRAAPARGRAPLSRSPFSSSAAGRSSTGRSRRRPRRARDGSRRG